VFPKLTLQGLIKSRATSGHSAMPASWGGKRP
jgi:hypothetical protein